MIKLITTFTEGPKVDPNYIKIASTIAAYGTGRPFCTAWRQDETLICRVDGNMTIYGDDFDAEEIRKFISAVGAKTLSCSVSAAEKLGYPYKKYTVMRSSRGMAAPADFSPASDEVYRLLSEGTDGDIALPERDAFMADLSHRVRHGTAMAAVFKSAVCVVPFMTDYGALICGVATEKTARGSGFAGMCVSATVQKLARPTFVICSEGTIPFYKKFGFSEWGENAEIIF
ncbi:MAG: hypothetical protein IKL44_00860 [Clostridia bacterium]|nr:hypothetical protein [Clostridia bacterium]